MTTGRLLRCIALAACVFLAGCTPPPERQDIRFAIAQAPLTLDPRYASDAASERVNRLLYRSLVTFDEHSRPVPLLARWQQISPQHYRFTLGREGRRFHDGALMTAADVAATYQSLLALKNSPHSAEFANIAHIQVLDVDNLDFVLHQPDDSFPARLIIGILPARLIAEGHDFARQPVGSGPLHLAAWNRTLTLQRVADGQVLVLEEVKDPTVRVLKLLRGEADLLQGDLQPELVVYLQRQPDVDVLTSPGANYSYLGFNMQDPVLCDVRVRHAVAMAIDRAELLRYALPAGSRAAAAILPPEHWAGNAALEAYPYNPQQARALLQQSGVQLPLKLVYKTSTDAQRVRLATIMQAQMREAGIDLEIRSLDWGTFFDDVKHGKFQLYGLTWVGIKTPEIYRLAFHSASLPPLGANRGRLQDAELDRLLDARDWKAATARIHAQLPYVPLWHEGQFAALRRDIIGYRPAADGNWDGLATISKH
jgi:peptide/nickel transport system substrate-binding protein